MIDTLQIAKKLQDNGLSQSAAEGLSEVLREFAANELATKNNLKQTEFALQKDMQEIKTELQKDMHEIKTELQKEMHIEIQRTKAELQKEIQKSKTQVIMWVAGFFITQTMLLFALGRLLN